MDREQLVMLRGAIDTLLAWPEAVRAQVAQWLAPEAPKPNGHDPHPPVLAPTPKAAFTPRPAASKPRMAKRHDNPAHARTAERRLLAAMRDHSGASVERLAEIVGAGRSTCGERLRRLAAQELVEKDPEGHWRVKAEEPRPLSPREEPGPTERPTTPPSS